MIIEQVSKQGRQAILVVGELVPIEESALCEYMEYHCGIQNMP